MRIVIAGDSAVVRAGLADAQKRYDDVIGDFPV